MGCVDTVILPVAGQGTRMLPATKVTPKELLPVYDTPLLQFAIDEALAAGARRIVLVTHPSKSSIQAYLAPAPDLEEQLARDGKADLLRSIMATRVPDEVEIVFVNQHRRLGLGHALLRATEHIDDAPIGVILPDDLILGEPTLAEMSEAFESGEMHSLVAAETVSRDRVSSYGIFDCAPSAAIILPAWGIVEKPRLEDAPTRLAVVGRYILSREVFKALGGIENGAGGEIQLTDAIAAAGGIHAFQFSGTRYDCGSKDGMVDATLAVQRVRKADELSTMSETQVTAETVERNVVDRVVIGV